jgi:hypothetical protein
MLCAWEILKIWVEYHKSFLFYFSSLIFTLKKLLKFMESPRHVRYMRKQLRCLQRKMHGKCVWGLLRWRQNLVKLIELEQSMPIVARCVTQGYVTLLFLVHLWWFKGEEDCWVPEICFSVEFAVWNIKYLLRWNFIYVYKFIDMISEKLLKIASNFLIPIQLCVMSQFIY